MRFALRIPSSLAAQLLLAASGGLLVVMLMAGAVLAALLMQGPADATRQGLEDTARHLERGMRFDAQGHPAYMVLSDKHQAMVDGLPKDFSYRVLDGLGRVLMSGEDGPAAQVLALQPVAAGETVTAASTGEVMLHILTRPVHHDGQDYVIQVARSDRLETVLRRVGGGIFVKGGVVAAVLAVGVFTGVVLLTLRRLLEPVRAASAAAARIGPHNLKARLDGTRLPRELSPLIDAFNQALQRLETGYRVQQDFLAAAAHELKTPLALIRAEVELDDAGGERRELLLKDLDFMGRQVHQLLHLAEVSEAQNYIFEPTDVASTVADAAGQLERLAGRHAVALQVQRPDAAVRLQADAGALFILVKNLAENAILHSPPGAVVTLAVDAQGLRVRDHGPGIAAAELPRVFERFWRGSGSSHQGAGLGLSICREIARAHGWTLAAANAQGGAEFSLTFASFADPQGASRM
jgi:signal transduction histidine kinase